MTLSFALHLSLALQSCSPILRTAPLFSNTAASDSQSSGIAVFSIAANTFTETFFGSSNSTTFTLTNTGTGPGTITARSLTTGTRYSITGGTCTVAAVIAAAGTCTVIVQFTPIEGTYTDTINVGYNDGAAAQNATRAISGVGHLQLGLSSAAQTEYPAGASVSSTGVITIQNSGATTATLTSIALTASPNYTIIGGGTCAAAGTITSGNVCTVNVSFSPGSPLTIDTNAYTYTPDLNGTVRVVYTKNGVSKTTDVAFTLYAAPFQSGLGTGGSPHVVHDEYQMRVTGHFCQNYSQAINGIMTLDTNIDLGGIDGGGAAVPGKEWLSGYDFTNCSLDGQSNTVSNLYIAGNGDGLFTGATDSNIRNLTINNFLQEVQVSPAGLLSPRCNRTTLTSVAVTGSTSRKFNNLFNGTYLGGFCGTGGDVVISSGSIVAIVESAGNNLSVVGGLVGTGSFTITNSTASLAAGGAVSDVNYLGGLVGVANYGSISGSQATVSFSPALINNGIGGLIGMFDDDFTTGLTVSNSSVTGTMSPAAVSGATSMGGLVGISDITLSGPQQITSARLDVTDSYSNVTYTNPSGSKYVGGLIGSVVGSCDYSLYPVADSNCTATGITVSRFSSFGTVTSADDTASVGGMIGSSTGSAVSIEKSFSDMDFTGTKYSAGMVASGSGQLTLTDIYYTGSITVPLGFTSGGGMTSDYTSYNDILNNTSTVNISNGYTGSVSITDTGVVPGYAVGGFGTNYVVSSFYARASGNMTFTDATQLVNGAGVGGIENELSFVGFDFDILMNRTWRMPLSLRFNYHDQLSPVFNWQCSAANTHPGSATCPP